MFSFHLENSTPFFISKVRVALFFVSWGPGLFLQRSVTFCFIVFLFVLGVPYIFSYGIQSHHFMGNRWGNSGNSVKLLSFWAPKSLQMVTAAMKLKDAYSLEGKL